MALLISSLRRTRAATLLLSTLLLAGSSRISSGQTGNPVADTSAALRTGDFEGALRVSGAALKHSPNDIRLLTLRGMAFAGEKKPALAQRCFESALKLSPAFLPALEGAAQIAYESGGAQAKPLLLRILSTRPSDPTANAMLAVIDYRAGDCPGAIEHFSQAEVLLPSQPDTLVEYGACLASTNRLEEAISVLEHAVELNPDNLIGRYNLALAQWNANRADDALSTLSPLLNESSAPEDVLTLAADIEEAKGDTQRAVELLRQAILAHPRDKAAYLQFAYLSYKHNSVQVGIDMVDVGLNQIPNAAELYVARGVLLSQNANSEKALDDFDKAMRLDPTLSYVGAAEGVAESQAHQSAAALATLRSAARQHPDDALTQYLLAEALTAEAAPHSPALAEGVAAAKRSVSLDPKRLEAHDLLASLYLRSGNADLSILQSQAALQIDSKDEEALYHEILALRSGDRKSEIPALVQRMMKAREAKATEAKPKVYRLVESPPNPETPAPK